MTGWLFQPLPLAQGGGDQNLSPGLYTEANTFFAPTVTPGPVNLAPSRFTDTDTFYAPTVSTTYSLTPGQFTEADVFFSPTVAQGGAGAQNLLPGLFADADIFYTPDVFIPTTIQPSADYQDGSWTNELGGTNLFPSIDELSPNDTDYIKSSDNPNLDATIVKLSIPVAQMLFPMYVAYRYLGWDQLSPFVMTGTVELRVRLLQEVTSPAGSLAEIASWTHNITSTGLVQTLQKLTQAQYNSITDFTKLYLEFRAHQGYSAEAQQFFDRVSDPGTSRKNLYAAMIDGLKQDGVWSDLDGLMVMGVDEAIWQENLVQDAYHLIKHGSPTFVSDRYIEGATGAYYSTGFDHAAVGAKFSSNSCSFGVWVIDTSSFPVGYVINYPTVDGDNQITMTPHWGSFVAWRLCVDAEKVLDGVFPPYPATLFLMSKTASTTRALYYNNAQQQTDTGGDRNLVSGDMQFMALHNATGGEYLGRVAALFWGAGLNSTKASAAHNRIQTYLQGIGAVP